MSTAILWTVTTLYVLAGLTMAALAWVYLIRQEHIVAAILTITAMGIGVLFALWIPVFFMYIRD